MILICTPKIPVKIIQQLRLSAQHLIASDAFVYLFTGETSFDISIENFPTILTKKSN